MATWPCSTLYSNFRRKVKFGEKGRNNVIFVLSLLRYNNLVYFVTMKNHSTWPCEHLCLATCATFNTLTRIQNWDHQVCISEPYLLISRFPTCTFTLMCVFVSTHCFLHQLGVIPLTAPGASDLSWGVGVCWRSNGGAPPSRGGGPCTHTARERPRAERPTPYADETEQDKKCKGVVHLETIHPKLEFEDFLRILFSCSINPFSPRIW